MTNCIQACPYNTLDGCKVKEYNAICQLTNMATPFTEYRMTNADRIRSMSDAELAEEISRISILDLCDIVCGGDCKRLQRLTRHHNNDARRTFWNGSNSQ